VNGSSCSSLPNTTARKIGQTFAFCLIFVVSLVGNSFIGIVVYNTQTLRKPINYFIANMVLVGLAVSNSSGSGVHSDVRGRLQASKGSFWPGFV